MIKKYFIPKVSFHFIKTEEEMYRQHSPLKREVDSKPNLGKNVSFNRLCFT